MKIKFADKKRNIFGGLSDPLFIWVRKITFIMKDPVYTVLYYTGPNCIVQWVTVRLAVFKLVLAMNSVKQQTEKATPQTSNYFF